MTDASKIFSIDVAAEIRKLTNLRYKSSYESILDVIRLAVDTGPRAVHLTTGRRTLTVTAEGGVVREEVFGLVAVIHDPVLDSDRRQKALAELESKHGLFVLGAFANRPSLVLIEWREDGVRRGLRFLPERSPRLYTPTDSEDADLRIVVKRRTKGARVRHRVAERCRFASVPISINGTLESRGKRIEGGLLEVDVASENLSGVVGLPSEGDVVRVTRLSRGVIQEEVVLPVTGGLVYSAVVEDTRDIWEDNRTMFRSAGRKLYRSLARRYAELPLSKKERAETLLIERFWYTRQEELLEGVTAFERVDGPPIDFFELRERVNHGAVVAIDKEASVDEYIVAGRFVLRLDKKQRRFVESVLRASLKSPPRRERITSFRERMRRVYKRSTAAVRRSISATGKPLDEAELAAEERAFLQVVRQGLQSGVYAVAGETDPRAIDIVPTARGPLPWARIETSEQRSLLHIPLHHPKVRGMVKAVSSDPAYLYPVLVLLSDGQVVHNSE